MSIKGIIKSNFELVGVVAHYRNDEEGKVFESLYDFCNNLLIPTIRGSGNELKTYNFILKLKPDLIWITDYKYILPKRVIEIPNLGVINLHPSILPKYRGRAPINWAIINGDSETGITAHFVDEGVDTGPIISQVKININDNDYVGDILEKLYPIYKKITLSVLNIIEKGDYILKHQQLKPQKIYPKREAKDGLILWDRDEKKIINLIRAVSRPYPGAFFLNKKKKYIIWKATFNVLNEPCNKKVGEIISGKDKKLKIKTKNGIIVSEDWEVRSNK